ncbi:hypothetical protein [Haloactinomyces albus]|uniref:Uncharacterized protein n=1 Tax=Haloactinomyces albus TaxID=1352928 RepID=A0AAE3ZGG8_9ACTN|nr:hypothetical protein [Haloactinomyces albus]MDR7303320.1 hypothetical protein [Haloactinomyces albus]
MTVVVITRYYDITADLVIAALARRDVPTARFDLQSSAACPCPTHY